MSQEWFSAAQLAGSPEMPGTVQRVNSRAKREGWVARQRSGRGGGREYHIKSLPEATRVHLTTLAIKQSNTEATNAGVIEGKKQATRSKVDTQARQYNRQTGLAEYVTLSERGQQRADARLILLTLLDEFTRSSHLPTSKALQSFCAKYNEGDIEVEEWVRQLINDIHPASIYRWRNRLDEKGAAGLAGNYKSRKGTSKIDRQPELQEFVQAMLTEHPHCGAAHVIKAARARFADSDVELPSKRGFERWINAWKNENAQVFSAVSNPDEWKNKYMLALGSASEDIVALNQRWEFDSTPADVMLLDGRHHIIGAIDIYSRRVKLLVSKSSESAAVATLVRRALLDWGKPDEAKTDNGSDYISLHIRRVFKSIDVEHLTCKPFAGWEKPFIERFFHTFSHDLVELLDGYIGHNVADRSAIEARKSFSDRLFKKDQVIDVNMTAAQLQAFCDDWVNNIYHHQPHSGLDNSTPFEMHTNWQGTIRRIDNERALDVLLAEAPGKGGMRTVTKNGIRLDTFNYISDELGVHVGNQVHVRYDPDDQGKIYVFNDDGFICIAEDPSVTGIDRKEVAARGKQKQKAHVQEARRELKRAARKVHTKDIVTEILAEQAKANNTLAFPGRSETYTSPGIEAAAQAAATQDAKGPETRELTNTERSARQKLAEQMANPAPVHELPETPRQRFTRWQQLDERVQSGKSIADKELKFHKSYQQTSEFRGLQQFSKSCGVNTAG